MNLDELLVGGNPTPEARALGVTDDDVAGGNFVDPAAVKEKVEKAAKKAAAKADKAKDK